MSHFVIIIDHQSVSILENLQPSSLSSSHRPPAPFFFLFSPHLVYRKARRPRSPEDSPARRRHHRRIRIYLHDARVARVCCGSSSSTTAATAAGGTVIPAPTPAPLFILAFCAAGSCGRRDPPSLFRFRAQFQDVVHVCLVMEPQNLPATVINPIWPPISISNSIQYQTNQWIKSTAHAYTTTNPRLLCACTTHISAPFFFSRVLPTCQPVCLSACLPTTLSSNQHRSNNHDRTHTHAHAYTRIHTPLVHFTVQYTHAIVCTCSTVASGASIVQMSGKSLVKAFMMARTLAGRSG